MAQIKHTKKGETKMKKIQFHGYYRIVSLVLGGLSILGSAILASNISYKAFDVEVFVMGVVATILVCMPLFAIDEHLDNQEVIQNQLEALAYELHEANKKEATEKQC